MTISPLRTEDGSVEGSRSVKYRDTVFVAELAGSRISSGQFDLAFAAGRESPLVGPVLVQVTPFLSSTPSTVLIGTRPTRVLLRCPDDAVEFRRIVALPKVSRPSSHRLVN